MIAFWLIAGSPNKLRGFYYASYNFSRDNKRICCCIVETNISQVL